MLGKGKPLISIWGAGKGADVCITLTQELFVKGVFFFFWVFSLWFYFMTCLEDMLIYLDMEVFRLGILHTIQLVNMVKKTMYVLSKFG